MYKITALHKALEDTVPMSELEVTNRQLNELTAKYRDLLQRENTLMARSAIVENLQVCFHFVVFSSAVLWLYSVNDYTSNPKDHLFRNPNLPKTYKFQLLNVNYPV